MRLADVFITISCVHMYVPGVSKLAGGDTSANRLTTSAPCPEDGQNRAAWVWAEAVAGLSVGSVLAAC